MEICAENFAEILAKGAKNSTVQRSARRALPRAAPQRAVQKTVEESCTESCAESLTENLQSALQPLVQSAHSLLQKKQVIEDLLTFFIEHEEGQQ